MKKKQITGFIIAALVFALVGSLNVVTKNYSAEKISSLKSISDYNLPMEEFIGIVKVEGTIIDTGSPGLFETAYTYNHKKTLDYIDDLMNSSSNRGILLYVDSPGGGVYESDELYLKFKEYSEKTERPILTYMASTAASGGYYISMASDRIYANRNVLTGSIGVIMAASNYKELMDKLGIKTILFTSGPNKSMGNPGIEMTDEQKSIYQSIVNESYNQFLNIVSEGRNIDIETLKPIADGRVYTANQALNLNLIDGIKTYDETLKEFKDLIGYDVTFYIPKSGYSDFSSLFSYFEKQKNSSEIDILTNYLNTTGKGVPMYYENIHR